MWQYVANRLLQLLPVLVLVSIAAFAFVHALPGDPVIALMGPEASNADPEVIENRREALGLNRPLPVQYLDWVTDALTGDLGTSAITGQEVTGALADRLPVTLQLAIGAFLIATVIALPAGVFAAYYHNTPIDRAISVIALLGVAMPSFWLGILLIILFSLQLDLLPPSGHVPMTEDPWESVQHLIMPALSLGAIQAGVLMRQVRSSLLEVLRQDYVRTARAKGLGERTVVSLHALRNAMLPVITIMGVQVSVLLGGSVITETVFALPGFGRYAVDAIFIRDYPVVQAAVLVTAVIVVVANLVTDLSYALVDPRIRY